MKYFELEPGDTISDPYWEHPWTLLSVQKYISVYGHKEFKWLRVRMNKTATTVAHITESIPFGWVVVRRDGSG